jgi:hypothetical protein
MQIINIKQIIGLVVLLLGTAGLTLASNSPVRSGNDNRTPDLPADCDTVRVEAGNKMARRVYAIGVQIYRWNGATWDFVAPEANLYADAGYHGKIGIHYEGPRWESNGGSIVQAARVPNTDCTPDPTAIPWLLLKKVSTEGNGIFSKTTFIQRVNTVGGLKPAAPGAYVGEEKRVPYTAEYYFYRAEN